MLTVKIPPIELYDEVSGLFINSKKEQVLQLEHSLVSLSKWESKWKKPFLGKEDKTTEETRDYIKCMTLTQNVNPEVYTRIPISIVNRISDYIEDPMTATTFSFPSQNKTNREVVTAEILYYYMIALNIPFECQKWHLNRLLTLINVCSIKNQPATKMSRKEIVNRNKALNEQRRQALKTKG